MFLGFYDMSIIFEALQGSKSKRSFRIVLLLVVSLILGVMLNRQGASVFVADLANIAEFKAAFLVLLTALVTTWVMHRIFGFASISHAAIGAIIGWLIFIGHSFPATKVLYIIFIWLLSPLLSFVLASWFLSLSKKFISRSKIHIFKLDYLFQIFTLIAAVLAIFSFGANNSANLTGVYLHLISDKNVQIFNWSIPAEIMLFLIMGISIGVGFIVSQLQFVTQRKAIIFKFSQEVNLSVLLAYTVVVFLFSSQYLQSFLNSFGFFNYQLVPLNSYYILTGALVGVSFKNGFNIYKKETLAAISVKALVTPLLSAFIAFTMFVGIRAFVGDENFWSDAYSEKHATIDTKQNIVEFTNVDTAYNLGVLAAFIVFAILGYYLFSRLRKKGEEEKLAFEKQTSALTAEKDFFLEKLKYERKTGDRLKQEIEIRNQELEKFALQLIEKEKILDNTRNVLNDLRNEQDEKKRKALVDNIKFIISDSLNLTKEREMFYSRVSNVNSEFFLRISQQFTQLTENDKRLMALLKLGLSSKEIASLFSISAKSVEMNRYRLRKKLNISAEQNLVEFISEL